MKIILEKEKIKEGKPIEVSSSPKIIVIFTGKNYYALSGICPHAKWPLDIGKVSNEILICAGHGWEYDISNGKCVSNPGRNLRQYKVFEDGSNIIISD
jgi:nitrite reductase/ring-hydroxylating ferredoxin subunit